MYLLNSIFSIYTCTSIKDVYIDIHVPLTIPFQPLKDYCEVGHILTRFEPGMVVSLLNSIKLLNTDVRHIT